MKVHHTLICFFFLSALQDGNPEVTKAQIRYYGVIGGDFKAGFSFNSPGTWKMFCREKCEGENILIKTTDVRAQTGRYSIEYKKESTYYVLSVSISKLTESDSGQYSCGLGGSPSSAPFTPFVIVVAEALLDGNDDPAQLKHFNKETGSSLTVACSFKQAGYRKMFCRGECGGEKILVHTEHLSAQRDRYNIGYVSESGVLYVSITQLTKSDSGRYRCLLIGSSSSSSREFEVTVTDAGPSATTTGSSTPSLTWTGSTEQPEGAASGTSIYVLLFVGLTLALIIILLSVSVLIFCKKRSSKPKDPPVETGQAAVTEEEDHSSKLTYSEVNFSKRTFGSPNGASSGNTGEVIYSAPRVNVSSDVRDDSLYSSVA
ncbi:uncharacterized protein LOC102075918 isoform X3 [Oreochromis niloticus]|uniref:uncharacterized protein LOC102075918 isoform X3 n=1 Tax=Oreochromis niloticus TaxID=8128 RepID=UPI000904A6A0|nr:uncharacterized protein LOC102075918 isoform X3 [Oreochromis niloticus]